MDYADRGKLYLVATPIGNLDDITLRALEILKESDYVLAEDTREADKLFQKYRIKKPTIAYTDQKNDSLSDKIIDDLDRGVDIALISDSGTPLISDPGYKLVRLLKNKGYEVISIPGPSSVTAALAASGLPSDKFVFLGFLPKSNKKRSEIISRYGNLEATLIIFESPYKIVDLIKECLEVLGNRPACLVKDLTKIYEKVQTSDLITLSQSEIKQKGEYILLIAKKENKEN
jgi:16S rRNA (cytidine1402-2'-O)-methyltransferase